MAPNLNIITGPYLRDLLEQPQALRAVIASLPAADALRDMTVLLASGKFRRVVLTGMGSSLSALYPLHLALHRLGYASHWLETAELLLGYDGLYRCDTLLVAVSQSGESGEIVSLLRRAGEFGHVVGVTNHPESSLGRQSQTKLLMHAGPETTVACKSYLNTLAVLHALAAAVQGRKPVEAITEFEAAVRGVEEYLARWREHVEELAELVRECRTVFVAGRAESLATALTAGLILKEATHRPAEGMSCAGFRHGSLELIGPNVYALVLAGNERSAQLNRRLYEDILRGGGCGGLAAVEGASNWALQLPPTAPELRPLVEILPVQMLTIALAALDGREAGRFTHATKITTAE